jgi:hypothetical protein
MNSCKLLKKVRSNIHSIRLKIGTLEPAGVTDVPASGPVECLWKRGSKIPDNAGSRMHLRMVSCNVSRSIGAAVAHSGQCRQRRLIP